MGENNSKLICDTLDVYDLLNKYSANHGDENLEILLAGYIKKNLPEIMNKHGLYGLATILSPETIDKDDASKEFKQKDSNENKKEIEEMLNIDNSNLDKTESNTSRFAESGFYRKDVLDKVENDAYTHEAPIINENSNETNEMNSVENIGNSGFKDEIIPEQFQEFDIPDNFVDLRKNINNPWSDAQTVSPGETYKTRVLE